MACMFRSVCCFESFCHLLIIAIIKDYKGTNHPVSNFEKHFLCSNLYYLFEKELCNQNELIYFRNYLCCGTTTLTCKCNLFYVNEHVCIFNEL